MILTRHYETCKVNCNETTLATKVKVHSILKANTMVVPLEIHFTRANLLVSSHRVKEILEMATEKHKCRLQDRDLIRQRWTQPRLTKPHHLASMAYLLQLRQTNFPDLLPPFLIPGTGNMMHTTETRGGSHTWNRGAAETPQDP